MKKPLVVALIALSFAALAEDAAAIPAFARRYGAQCSFCHQGFPKLTYEGQRFKERGFRMPAEAGFDAAQWIRSVPIVGRAQLNHFLLEDFDDSTSGYVKAISAGNLGSRFAYWADDAWLIREKPENATPEFERVTHLKPNNLYGRIELIRAGKLYVKGGRFELDLPFTQVRSPNLLSYEVYSFKPGFESDDIGSYQDGGEVGGTFSENWHASLAVVKGRNNRNQEPNSEDVGAFDANVFLRAARRVERHRFGAFAYFANSTLAPSPRVVFENSFQRYGLDADVWFRKLNLYGLYQHGHDDNPNGDGASQTFDGGFAQFDWHARDFLVVSSRLNVLNRLAGSEKRTFTSFVPGIRVYLFKHARLAFEYAIQNRDRNDIGAFQAELVF